MPPSISIVMPTYELGPTIAANIDAVAEALAGLSPEIVVVDDGSTDQTPAEVAAAAERHPTLRSLRLATNRGKGRALLEGAAIATGDVVVFLDADLDLPPDQIPALVELTNDADVVVGTKRTSMATGAYPGVRRLLSRIFAIATGGVFRLPVSETQTGLKAFRREVLDRIGPHVRIDRYAFDLELLVRAHVAGFRLVETPVRLGPGAADASLRPSMMWNLGRDTARIAWWRLSDPSFRRP